MDIHLDARAEELIELHLHSGRYRSAEEVVASALEVFPSDPPSLTDESARKRAVREMREFAEKHRSRLGPNERIRDLVHEGHKY